MHICTRPADAECAGCPAAATRIGIPYNSAVCFAWQGFDAWLSWDTNPLYALLHEACYCNGGPSNWAAQRVRDTHYSEHFDAAMAAANGRPVMFTGEPQMMCKLAWQVCRSQPLRGRIMAWDQECVRADLVLSCVF